MCWPHETAPGSPASSSSTRETNARSSGSSGCTAGKQAGRADVDDRPVRREQRLELAPAEELHRQVPVVGLVGQQAGADDRLVLVHAVAAHEVEQDRQEVRDGPDERHHRDEHVPARPGHADELGDPLVRPVDHVAERAAEADRGVEARVVPAREVEHVGELALDHVLLEALGRDALPVQLELSAARGRRR